MGENMPKVSVIVPAYNAEAYIEQCIGSLLAQTMLEDLQLVVIDDGSTDRTGELLEAMLAGREHVILRHQENHGLYATRRIGLSLSAGDYIGWVDADDFTEPDMFEALYQAAIKGSSELAMCDYDWYPEKSATKEKWFRPYEGRRDTRFAERNSQPWNKLVSRQLLERLEVAGGFESCFDEIYIRVLLEAKNPVTISRPLYHYRVVPGTMSGSYTNIKHYERFITASEALARVAEQHYPEPYWADYFSYRISYYRLMTMIVAANAGNSSVYRSIRRDLLAERPRFWRNQHFFRLLRENYGILKALVIGCAVPLCYPLARLACQVGFR